MERRYWISIGESRFAKKWKNQEVTWDELLYRFKRRNATRTQETLTLTHGSIHVHEIP